MRLYKFANNVRVNVDLIKDNLSYISDVEECYGNYGYSFTIQLNGSNDAINLGFDDEIVAREELKNFVEFLTTLC